MCGLSSQCTWRVGPGVRDEGSHAGLRPCKESEGSQAGVSPTGAMDEEGADEDGGTTDDGIGLFPALLPVCSI